MWLTIDSFSLQNDTFVSVFFDKAYGDGVDGVILKHIGKKKIKGGRDDPGMSLN